MSLHKFAEQVASQGRGDDSLLVHMTPDEVRNLQQFAQANGTTLTINPTTGLPEAGLLSDLFKAVAPIALGAFLGPAGAAIGGGFMSAGMAGLATGGITALATGSLSRGLMAGLGAYGGAGLGESLMKAGTGALSQSAGAGLVGDEAIQQAVGAKLASATPMETLTAGFNSATANPAAMGAFAKNNLSNLGFAAAPIMAMQPTTKMPSTSGAGAGHIRQMDFNINPDTGKPDPLYGVREMTPVKATEWGDKTFQGQRELFRKQNPNPYEIGVASLNQPPGMAGGGIVALAGGGVSDQQVVDWFKANPGADDQKIAAAMQQYNVDPTQVARATGTEDKLANYTERYETATNQNILDYADQAGGLSTATTGGTGTAAIADWMDKSGISAKEYSDALTSRFGAANPYTEQGIQSLYNTATKVGGQADIINAASPIADIHDTRNDKAWVDWMDANNVGIKEAARSFGLSDAEVQQRYNDAKLKPVIKPVTSVIPGGYYGNKTGDPRTTTPGDITTNPDGTVTVHPNIPGRPTGGFTGMGQVKDTYTAGGGSLGYTPYAPKTVDEFNQLFNKQTGDSLAAYNYLMGKGANPVKSGVGKISQNYDEFVLGKKPGSALTRKTSNTATVQGTPGQPQTYFNEAEYLAANPDVAAELKSGKAKFTNAYEHYLMYGKQEGRPFTGDYQGYVTAAALAAAAGAGGGGDAGPSGPSGTTSTVGLSSNEANSITGLAAAPNDSISVTDAVSSPATSGDDGDDGDDGGEDAVGGYYSRGKLNYRSKDMAMGGATGYAMGGGLGSLGSYSDGGRLLRGPGDGVSDSIPATIGRKQQPARLADGEFVIPARIVSELGNGSTDAGAKKLYAMMDRVQRARGKTTGKNKVAANSRADKHLPA